MVQGGTIPHGIPSKAAAQFFGFPARDLSDQAAEVGGEDESQKQ